LGERGSVVIESLFSLVAVVTIVSSGLIALYFSFARVWTERSAYEAVMCLATSSPMTQCESEFRQRVSRALPFGKIDQLSLRKNPKEASIDLRLKIGTKDILRVRDARNLPLEPSGGRR
jgi:hypothetical protein